MTLTVVAGGAGDIGSAIARRIMKGGEKVAIWDCRDPKAGTDQQPNLFVKCDITDVVAVERALKETQERFGSVACLVNSAGLGQHDAFLDSTETEWSRILKVNLEGPANTIRAVLPEMVTNASGVIINICSIWSRRVGVDRSAYIASKWGLLGLTKSLSSEYKSQGIRFTAVSPGPVLTEMTRDFVSEKEAQTWMSPSDVAEVVWFAASSAGGATVGGEIEVPGWGTPAGGMI